MSHRWALGLFVPLLTQCAPARVTERSEPYTITATTGGHRARNVAQGYEVTFDRDAWWLRSDVGHARLSLRCVGRRDVCKPPPPIDTVRANGDRIEYARGSMREWYVNGPRGIEQGFLIRDRQPGATELVVAIDVAGAEVTAIDGGDALGLFHDHLAVARVDELNVVDDQGRNVRAWMTAAPGGLELHIDDRDATYPLSIDPLYGADGNKLLSITPVEGQEFGRSVSISGDLALIGAATGEGAFCFARTGATWAPQSWLYAPDAQLGDGFGQSVALSGLTAIVGAPGVDVAGNTDAGAAYILVRGAMKFSPQAKLVASDPVAGAGFGIRAAIDGETAVVVAQASVSGPPSGAVYVFVRSGTAWTQQQKLVPTDVVTTDAYGSAVALHRDTIVVGAQYANSKVGAAYVFVRNAGVWTQQQKLTMGGSGAWFGRSVAVHGETTLIGASADYAASGTRSGAAYVFARSGSTWTLQQKLEPSDGTENHRYGDSVALSGDTAVVGAYIAGAFAGAAYVSTRTGTAWTEQAKLTAKDAAPGAAYGYALALNGDKLVVGSVYATANTTPQAGAAYVYRLAPLEPAGARCTRDGDCISKHCAMPEGVCCDRGCDGPCESCVAAQKVGGADGVCGPAKANTDPRDACTPATGTCAADGLCDGAGSCRSFAGAGTSCGGASCAGGVAKAMVCKGDSAACIEATNACEPYVCGESSCKTSCASSADCAAKYRCSAGRCEPGESRCADDGSKAINTTSGLEKVCSPFRCDEPSGSCPGSCTSEAQCQVGFRCTSDGVCAVPPSPSEDVGCTLGGPTVRGYERLLALVALAAIAGLRRAHSLGNRRIAR